MTRTIIRDVTERRETSLSHAYNVEEGVTYSIYLVNLGMIADYEVKFHLSREDAPRLQNNLEVFYIATLDPVSELPMAIQDHDIRSAPPPATQAWNIKNRIIVARLKAILYCDAATKEVVKTVHY